MKRMALMALAVPLVALATGAEAQTALAQKNGCISCHHASQKRIGPSYQDIAAKYAGDKAAPEALAKTVRTGGVGVWGKIPMPPNPRISEADAKALAAWILKGAP